ncbi:LytR/AlgR family response regulator transcription factor [Anaerosporobacter faecicola]|uniref:LytR/AlgR family response regulator transcription factor n=1 Tax=Anaerosporobacter faecicola TaxID=2718714 RepID=UPI001438CB19|nr:LytTR family DNA-binding domain-containing protein [Anaerosporobacter faecicola]
MLTIILCDDDRFILQLEEEKIRSIIEMNKLTAVKIGCVSMESSEIFTYMKKNVGPFLVFLDLDFGCGKLNGIDVAKQLKSIQSQVKIVFVTNHHEMAMKVLQSGVEPFGFIEKTTNIEQLGAGYRRYIQLAIASGEGMEEKEEVLKLTIGFDETVTIPKPQILYVESEKMISHGVTYHTMDGSCITVRDTMEHVLKQLGENFVRVHRSIVVNHRYMVSLTGMNIRLSNGEEVPCAVRMRNEVKAWLKS